VGGRGEGRRLGGGNEGDGKASWGLVFMGAGAARRDPPG
jgi:hypothetical protein